MESLTKLLGRTISLILYYGIAQHLPGSYTPIFGKVSNKFRIFCCKHIFKYCGKVSTIDRHAYFGNGKDIEIGDYSGIGEDCVIPHNTIIGRYVMMAPEIHIVSDNHGFGDTTKPMCFQVSNTNHPPTTIEDDVWIGVRVILTPAHHIGKGSILAAGAVITHDVEPYSIVGGNPAKLIRKRK